MANKFKPGDKIIRTGYSLGNMIQGKTYTVAKLSSYGNPIVEELIDESGWDEDLFELAPTETISDYSIF